MMSIEVFALYLLICFSLSTSLNPSCCHKGTWTQNKRREVAFWAARSSQPDQRWLHEACPAEAFLHNGFGTGHVNRTIALEKREFVPDDETCCKPFFPLMFANLVKNKKLVFIGDSIMMQIFQSLVCRLYKTVDIDVTGLKWWYYAPQIFVRTYNLDPKLFNPFGSVHSHLGPSELSIPSLNITLSFLLKPVLSHTNGSFLKLLKDNKITRNDVIVINFGLHVANEADMIKYILNLNKDFQQIGNDAPNTIFVETTPTHFSNSKNGYFRGHFSNTCAPLQLNESELYHQDYRNRILSQELTKRMKIAKISGPLYSQWDAHTERIKRVREIDNITFSDCTHWLFPSNVFEYILRSIYNYIQE